MRKKSMQFWSVTLRDDLDDVVRMTGGPGNSQSMGMRAAFQVVPLFIGGGVVRPIPSALGVALAAAYLGLGLARTRIRKVIAPPGITGAWCPRRITKTRG